jgi:hypothetical protein
MYVLKSGVVDGSNSGSNPGCQCNCHDDWTAYSIAFNLGFVKPGCGCYCLQSSMYSAEFSGFITWIP